MDTVTRLFLLRHGEVAAPYQRVFGGRIDMELSPQGMLQAKRLGEYLHEAPLRTLYVSPMKRAQQTAAAMNGAGRYPQLTLSGLREVDFGAWTGLGWYQVKERFGVSAFDWLRELHRGGIPEAESNLAFSQRVEQCLRQVVEAHPGQAVGLLCHGGVIRMLLALLLGVPLPQTAAFEIDYASVTVVDHHPRKTEVQLLNFTPWCRPW